MVENARYVPDDEVLNELNSDEFRALGMMYKWDSTKELEDTAEKVLLGIVPGFQEEIGMPFNSDDLEKSLPGKQVKLAGLFVPDLLINAYLETGREVFFTAARDVILNWASYERKLWLPKGMIWNDYAIAARNQVLIKFWTVYRKHPSFQVEVAKDILQFLFRGGKFLAKSSHFTFNSNHGIIQNLALLRLYLAFPTFPEITTYKELALTRLKDQMAFYINDEGVVLEHSAHYQYFGVHLAGILMRSMTLMGEPIPEEWPAKYNKAINYFSHIRRPDGSLPMYGDTHPPGKTLSPPVANNGSSNRLSYKDSWVPKYADTIYPVSGYSIWWDGLDSGQIRESINQTTVSWSYFPDHGHKHADEMSVLLYAGGQTWWTNSGYWTYGTWGRSKAVSWSGSNAPHLVGESTKSDRRTELKYYGFSDELAVIDLERSGPDNYKARRQVIHVKPKVWIVVDSISGDKENKTRTIWTTLPNTQISDAAFPNSYYLKGEDKSNILSASFLTSTPIQIKKHKGNKDQFMGWVKNRPAESLVLEQPAHNSWAVAIWSLENNAKTFFPYSSSPYMHKWQSPDSWKLVLPFKTGQLSIDRKHNVYAITDNSTRNAKTIKLEQAPSDISGKYNAIRDAFKKADNKYAKFKAVTNYRWKLTYLILFLFLAQTITFFIYNKINGRYYTGLRFTGIISWISLGVMWEIVLFLKA